MRILNQAGETVGVGFLVGRDLAVTCAHVVRKAQGRPGGLIRTQWYPERTDYLATVLEEGWSPGKEDVAFLRVTGLPASAVPARLGSAQGAERHTFETLGFPRSAWAEERIATGMIAGLVQGKEKGQLLQIDGNQVTFGMSGAPVLDVTRGRVIGMVAGGEEETHTRLAYATPVDTLARLYGEVQLEPGRKMGEGAFLPENYVERPAEYEAVITALLDGHTAGVTTALKRGGGVWKDDAGAGGVPG